MYLPKRIHSWKWQLNCLWNHSLNRVCHWRFAHSAKLPRKESNIISLLTVMHNLIVEIYRILWGEKSTKKALMEQLFYPPYHGVMNRLIQLIQTMDHSPSHEIWGKSGISAINRFLISPPKRNIPGSHVGFTIRGFIQWS